MKKLAFILRIITIPPLMALSLITILLIRQQVDIYTFIILFLFLVILPSLSYLLEHKFKIYKKIKHEENDRTCYRNMSIIVSFFSYTILLFLIFFNNYPTIVKLLVLTYFISIVLMSLSTFILKIKASGHMCGFSGPVFFLSFTISYWFLFLYLLITIVIYSSLKLKRHTISEIIIGFFIPILSFLISYCILL